MEQKVKKKTRIKTHNDDTIKLQKNSKGQNTNLDLDTENTE